MATVKFDPIDEQVKQKEMAIASKMLRLRTEMNVQAGQLAEIIGISEEELASYEHGAEPVPASVLVLIAAAFGVEFDYFYTTNELEITDTSALLEEAFATMN